MLLAEQAMKLRKRLDLKYNGATRIVEVHAAGYNKDGKLLMRVWQVRGGSLGKSPTPWRLLRFDEVSNARLTDEESEAPRPGYKRNDPAIFRIICEL